MYQNLRSRIKSGYNILFWSKTSIRKYTLLISRSISSYLSPVERAAPNRLIRRQEYPSPRKYSAGRLIINSEKPLPLCPRRLNNPRPPVANIPYSLLYIWPLIFTVYGNIWSGSVPFGLIRAVCSSRVKGTTAHLNSYDLRLTSTHLSLWFVPQSQYSSKNVRTYAVRHSNKRGHVSKHSFPTHECILSLKTLNLFIMMCTSHEWKLRHKTNPIFHWPTRRSLLLTFLQATLPPRPWWIDLPWAKC